VRAWAGIQARHAVHKSGYQTKSAPQLLKLYHWRRPIHPGIRPTIFRPHGLFQSPRRQARTQNTLGIRCSNRTGTPTASRARPSRLTTKPARAIWSATQGRSSLSRFWKLCRITRRAVTPCRVRSRWSWRAAATPMRCGFRQPTPKPCAMRYSELAAKVVAPPRRGRWRPLLLRRRGARCCFSLSG
jgi:hypothetical protein